jgi:hypothetical protein
MLMPSSDSAFHSRAGRRTRQPGSGKPAEETGRTLLRGFPSGQHARPRPIKARLEPRRQARPIAPRGALHRDALCQGSASPPRLHAAIFGQGFPHPLTTNPRYVPSRKQLPRWGTLHFACLCAPLERSHNPLSYMRIYARQHAKLCDSHSPPDEIEPHGLRRLGSDTKRIRANERVHHPHPSPSRRPMRPHTIRL